jgi:GH35 family endo-1,4-beta-xylanase
MWEAAPKNLPHRNWPHLESFDDICEYVIPVMRWAREEDPDAKYVINDYGMELDSPGREIRHHSGTVVTAKSQRQRFVELFKRLHAEGATPDALGMQAHTGSWMDPLTQYEILEDFAQAGVPLHYTEFWAETGFLEKAGMDPETIEQKKADYIAQVLTVAFSHPAVEAFAFWGDLTKSFGFRQDHNSQGMPSSSHQPTATYWRVKHLLTEEWRTRESLVSDENGCVRFDGFFGDYSLRYELPSGMPAGVTFEVNPMCKGPLQLVLHSNRP